MMAGKEEITWPEFKELINLQGGRSFEKALGSKVGEGLGKGMRGGVGRA